MTVQDRTGVIGLLSASTLVAGDRFRVKEGSRSVSLLIYLC